MMMLTDGAVWDSLMADMPEFKDCGRRFKSLKGGVAENHPELRLSNLGEYPSLALIQVELSE